jgi:hypothetical protein
MVLYVAIFAAGVAWTASILARSSGVASHDEVAHFLISRSTWEHPSMVLKQWGRPLNTLLYVVPSLGGLVGAHVFSIAMSSLAAITATFVAKEMGVRRLWLVPLLFFAQPWLGGFGWAAMTEVPFMLFAIGAVFFVVKRRYGWASLVIGCLPLIRHEGIVLLGAWGAWLLWKRRGRDIAVLLAPIAVYAAAFSATFKTSPAAIFLNATIPDRYGTGSWGHYLPPIYRGAGLLVLVLAALGWLVSRGKKPWVFLGFVLYFGVHTVLYHFGLYASGGYAFFMFPLAPAFACFAALGGDEVVGFFRRGALSRILPGFVAAALIAAAVVSAMAAKPKPLDPEGVIMRDVAAWVRAQGFAPSRVIARHPWFAYDFDRRYPRMDHSFTTTNWPVGTVVVWDQHYAGRYGAKLADLRKPPWRVLKSFDHVAVVVERTTP